VEPRSSIATDADAAAAGGTAAGARQVALK
jgi:hypothetical protein